MNEVPSRPKSKLATFVAHARTDIAALLAEVRRHQSALQESHQRERDLRLGIEKLAAIVFKRNPRESDLVNLEPYTLVEDARLKLGRQRVWEAKKDGEVTLIERQGKHAFRACVDGVSVSDEWHHKYDAVQLLRRQAARLEHAATFIETQRAALEVDIEHLLGGE